MLVHAAYASAGLCCLIERPHSTMMMHSSKLDMACDQDMEKQCKTDAHMIQGHAAVCCGKSGFEHTSEPCKHLRLCRIPRCHEKAAFCTHGYHNRMGIYCPKAIRPSNLHVCPYEEKLEFFLGRLPGQSWMSAKPLSCLLLLGPALWLLLVPTPLAVALVLLLLPAAAAGFSQSASSTGSSALTLRRFSRK